MSFWEAVTAIVGISLAMGLILIACGCRGFGAARPPEPPPWPKRD